MDRFWELRLEGKLECASDRTLYDLLLGEVAVEEALFVEHDPVSFGELGLKVPAIESSKQSLGQWPGIVADDYIRDIANLRFRVFACGSEVFALGHTHDGLLEQRELLGRCEVDVCLGVHSKQC
jgi:hypothetical protein